MKRQTQEPLPPDAQALIGEIWQAVQIHPEHALPPQHREILYRTLWPSLDLSGARREIMLQKDEIILSPDDIQFGELAIRSAQHVLPIWDRFATPGIRSGKGMGQEIRLPRWILEVARDVLRDEIEPIKAYDLLGDFYDLVGEVSHLVPYPIWSVASAAYAALNTILGGAPFLVSVDDTTGVEGLTDEDPAMYAANACSVSDDNPSGEWHSGVENALPLAFHADYALVFWEWWLGTAIPAAWQK